MRCRKVPTRAVLIAALVVVGSACSDSTGSKSEVVGAQQQAIWGGSADTTPALRANVVVKIGIPTLATATGACSGTLITPRVVLTAAHCVHDNNGAMFPSFEVGIGVDSQNFLFTSTSNQAVTFRNFTPPLDSYSLPINLGRDLALLFLNDPVLEQAIILRPRIVTPDPSAFHTGLAGWSPLNDDGTTNITASRFRTSAFFGPGLDASRYDSGWFEMDNRTNEYHWEINAETAGSQSGDSGGAFFIRNETTQQRDLIGVIHGRNDDGETFAADVTSPAAVEWLSSTLLDKNRNGGHPAGWYAAHGKDEDTMWFGETDYTGECDTARDPDCDHWFTEHDNCPFRFNPTQGAGDEADPDGDGLCSGSGANADNCPFAFNPDQANCNADAERASIARGNNISVMGDACDPVPCPRATPVGPPASQNCLSGPRLYRLLRDELDVRPVAPHATNGTSASLANVPTKARYCQAVSAETVSVRCDRPDQMLDLELFEAETAAARLEPRADRPWQRVTTAVTRSQLPFASRESNLGHSLTYADGSAASVFWDYLADDAFWRARGNLVGSEGAGDADCTKSIFGTGTCLNGTFWLKADSEVGNTMGTVGVVNVGTHGADLANHYFSIRPDETYIVPQCQLPPMDPCLFTPLGCFADFLYRFEDGFCPMCSTHPHVKAIADDRIQLPVVRKADESLYGVLWKDALDNENDLAIAETSTLARDVLLSFHVFSAVETAAPHPGDVDAIAFGSDVSEESYYFRVGNSSIGDAFDVEPVILGGGVAAKTTAQSMRASTEPAILGRTGSRVLYSRTMQGAFLLGGLDSSGTAASTVEYAPLYAPPYPIAGWLYADVLAATLTRPSTPVEYAGGTALPSFLWTVERDLELGDVRIVVREISRDEVGVPLFSVPLEDGGDDYALATAWDTADTVLLTLSERTTGKWGVVELGGFASCVAEFGSYDPSCFSLRPHYHRGDLGISTHLFRGAYAEHDAMVFPNAYVADWLGDGAFYPRVDRARKPALATAQTILPEDLRTWWTQ